MSLEKKILHLVVKNGASTSKYSFEVESIIAGRNPDSPLPLIHKDISRKHIGIYIRGTDVLIEDLGSTNGTFVNGQKLTPFAEKIVSPSDDIWIGGLKAIHLEVELEYFNLPLIEEVRAEQDAADTMIFEKGAQPKPLSSPLRKVSSDTDPFVGIPKVPSPNQPAKIPQNILKAPETERAVSTRSDNMPSSSAAQPTSRRAQNEEMYLAQLEEIKQKIIIDTNNKAADIVRAAKMDAEMRTQDIYAAAQKARKEAEDFYIKRIHEAGRAAEEIQREAQKHSDDLFMKTRDQCENLRRSTTESLTVMQTNAQKDCEKMYTDMEQQVRQTKARRLADFDVNLQHREKDYLAELDKKNEEKQQEFIEKIERRRLEHDLSLKEEREEFENRIAKELNEHIDKIERETLEHVTRITSEKEAHESKITSELSAHIERITRETTELENKISSDLQEHDTRIARELEEHSTRLETELQAHNEKISQELEAHTLRITTESEEHARRLSSENSQHEEKVRNESAALVARIERELEEHQQQIAKEKQEWETTLARSQEEWNTKLAELEKQHEEYLTKTAEAKTDFEKQSADLTKVSAELEKTQTFLKATMSSYEQVRKDLDEVQTKKQQLIKEFAAEKSEYENISGTKKRITEEIQDLEKQLEREKLALKDKLENERGRYAKNEIEYSTALRQETLNQIKKLEMEMMTNIDRKKATIAKELLFFIENNSQVINTQPESWRKERDQLEKDLITQFDRNIHGMTSESSIPKDMDLKKQSRKVAFKQTTMGLVMGLALMIGGQYVYKKMYGPSPLERAVASQQEARQKDLQVRKFNPPKDPDVRDSYVDSVIYTQGFVEILDQDAYQKDFSFAMAKQMLKLWKVDEDSSLQAASISRTLVKALQEKKQSIHPDYVQNGLAKMRELEKESRERITKLLGTNVRYEAFKRMEKEYFEKHRNMQ